MSDIAKILEQTRREIIEDGHNGWANAVQIGLEEIDRLESKLKIAEQEFYRLKKRCEAYEGRNEALRALLESADADNLRLKSLNAELLGALERTTHALRLAFTQKPLRDMAETLAEADSVISKAKGGGE